MKMVYVFSRSKKDRTKTVVAEFDTENEARYFCKENNSPSKPNWYEFTSKYEYTKNR